jgi:ATP-dependent phosphofructokinase / diphosphate-dependent phosphofructokinase
VLGILNEEFIDLASESQQTIRALRHTPGAALGTCRYKLKKQADFERVLEVFKAHNIRYFFYAGGNDSQDTADKISKLAQQQGYELRVIGIPKTIDNDLPVTDHCPGYGSVIKYIATTVREMACDNEAMGQHDLVSILEVMGRNAGWIAAGAALAKRRDHPHDPPHIILLPEVAFSPEEVRGGRPARPEAREVLLDRRRRRPGRCRRQLRRGRGRPRRLRPCPARRRRRVPAEPGRAETSRA